MNVGITGSKGFIGGHIKSTLSKNKKIKVYSCERPKCDLLDASSIEKFVKDKDIIIHTAAINRGTDEEIISGSVVATYNLITAIKELKKKPKVIFLSSTQAETESLYGLSKKLCETMLEDFSKRSDVSVSIFRLTNIFGEGCKPFYNSVIATFCYQAVNGKEFVINDPNKKFAFVYVGDVVKIIEKEVLAKRKNPFYFKRVSTEKEISIGQLAEKIKLFSGNKKLKFKNKFLKDLYKTYLSYEN